MSVSGNKWYGKDMPKHNARLEAVQWTLKLWRLAVCKGKRVTLENPASVIFPVLKQEPGVTVQYIQPYQFGHMEQKKTGYEEMMKLPKNVRERLHYMPPGPNRKRDRSVTYQGIADAFADQWGNL